LYLFAVARVISVASVVFAVAGAQLILIFLMLLTMLLFLASTVDVDLAVDGVLAVSCVPVAASFPAVFVSLLLQVSRLLPHVPRNSLANLKTYILYIM